jgi:hypothetical protein
VLKKSQEFPVNENGSSSKLSKDPLDKMLFNKYVLIPQAANTPILFLSEKLLSPAISRASHVCFRNNLC